MASNIKNTGGKAQAIGRGVPANLGTIALVNDVVAFTVPMDTFYSQGGMIIAVDAGIVGGTFALEASIDGGVNWFTVTMGTAITTAQFGDTAVSAAFVFGAVLSSSIAGFGSGAQFRFGLTAVTSGSAAVWVLAG